MAVMGNMDIGAGFALLTAVLVVFMQTGASLMAENRQPLILCSVMMERFQWLFGSPPDLTPSPLSLSPLFLHFPPGFALLETGSARSRDAQNVFMKNIMDMCFGSLAFFAIGYALSSGDDVGGIMGGSKFFLADAEPEDHLRFFYNYSFATNAATIFGGAVAGRTRFMGFVTVASVVAGLLYPIVVHWVSSQPPTTCQGLYHLALCFAVVVSYLPVLFTRTCLAIATHIAFCCFRLFGRLPSLLDGGWWAATTARTATHLWVAAQILPPPTHTHTHTHTLLPLPLPVAGVAQWLAEQGWREWRH